MTAPKRKRAPKPATGSKGQRLAPKSAAAEAAKQDEVTPRRELATVSTEAEIIAPEAVVGKAASVDLPCVPNAPVAAPPVAGADNTVIAVIDAPIVGETHISGIAEAGRSSEGNHPQPLTSQGVEPGRADEGNQLSDLSGQLENSEKSGVNPPDLDGDDKPGGSMPQLWFNIATTAWSACSTWSALQDIACHDWEGLAADLKLELALAARSIANGESGDYRLAQALGSSARWEEEVRYGIFAAVVRSIAL